MLLLELFRHNMDSGRIVIIFPELPASKEISEEKYDIINNKLINFSRVASNYANKEFFNFLRRNKIITGYSNMLHVSNFDTAETSYEYPEGQSVEIIFNTVWERQGLSKFSPEKDRVKKNTYGYIKTFFDNSLKPNQPLDRIAQSLEIGVGHVKIVN